VKHMHDFFSELHPGIFLTYANTPLKNNPKGLYRTLEEMKKQHSESFISEIKTEIDKMVEVDKMELPEGVNLQDMEDLLRDLPNDFATCADLDTRLDDDERRLWVGVGNNGLAVKKKGRKIIARPPRCQWRKLRKSIFDTEGLKCYECDHQHFTYILTEIANGQEFLEIKGLDDLLIGFSMSKHFSFEIKKTRRPPYKEVIKLRGEWLEHDIFDWNLCSYFPEIFAGTVTRSLVIFFTRNDPRKIKKCHSCEDFFIARNEKREVCYPPKECEENRQRNLQRELMRRKRDKDSPDYDPKYAR